LLFSGERNEDSVKMLTKKLSVGKEKKYVP
jgi:hypothetical protein